MKLLVVLLASTLTLAGCFGQDPKPAATPPPAETPPTLAADAPREAAANESASSSPSSSSSSSSPQEEPAKEEAAKPALPPEEQTAQAESGVKARGVCHVPGGCTVSHASKPAQFNFKLAPAKATLTATWSPSAAVHEKLNVTFTQDKVEVSANGTSPLVLELPAALLGVGFATVSVWPADVGAVANQKVDLVLLVEYAE